MSLLLRMMKIQVIYVSASLKNQQEVQFNYPHRARSLKAKRVKQARFDEDFTSTMDATDGVAQYDL